MVVFEVVNDYLVADQLGSWFSAAFSRQLTSMALNVLGRSLRRVEVEK